MRNFAMQIHPDADYYLIVDPDEIHETHRLQQARNIVAKERPAWARIPYFTRIETIPNQSHFIFCGSKRHQHLVNLTPQLACEQTSSSQAPSIIQKQESKASIP